MTDEWWRQLDANVRFIGEAWRGARRQERRVTVLRELRVTLARLKSPKTEAP